jgi:long-chain acyl-CoA synthetase
VVANMLQVEEWLQPAVNTREGNVQLNFVCCLPLYHIFA